MRYNSKFKIQNSAFTMVELIFVIVVIGILSYVGSTYMPDNRLSNDTKFLLSKIREKQKNAIGYDKAPFGVSSWSINDTHICIDLNTTKLENDDNRAQKPYRFSSTIKPSDYQVCFDSIGRPYNASSEHLLLKVIDINITKGSRARRLKLFPMSGYVTIVR